MKQYLISGVVFLACFQGNASAMTTEVKTGEAAVVVERIELKWIGTGVHIYSQWANLEGCPNAVSRTASIKKFFDDQKSSIRSSVRSPKSTSKSFFRSRDGKEDTQEFWDNVLKSDFPVVCLNASGNFIAFGLLEEVKNDTQQITHINVHAIVVDEKYADKNFEPLLLYEVYKKYVGIEVEVLTPDGYDRTALVHKALKLIKQKMLKLTEL